MTHRAAVLSLLVGLALACLDAQAFGKPVSGCQDQVKQAQPRRPTAWWMDREVRTKLELTDTQSERIRAVVETAIPEQRELVRRLHGLEDELDKALDSGEVDEAALLARLDHVEHARYELSRSRSFMLYRIYRQLTREQRQKLHPLSHDIDRFRQTGKRHE